MREKRVSYFFRTIVVLLFSFCVLPLAAGQTVKQSDEKETLQDLLSEVRMLRQAMQGIQRMSLDTYRSQLMVDRIRANREDVRRLAAALKDTRDLITRTQTAIPQTLSQQKLLETQLQSEADPKAHAQLEFELKRAKDGVEIYKAQLDPLKEREQQLASDLRIEQTKLDELESRLDLLERAIESESERLHSESLQQIKKP